MQIIKLLVSNYIYIVWFVIYFSIAWTLQGGGLSSFIWLLVVYGISIAVALSPLGEFILRVLKNCREPLTMRERDYLLPLFEEVYQDAKEMSPKLNNNINLYIMDAMYVDSFAIGRETIAITRGAIETFSAEELKGIFAHELGHMEYGHTKALLLSNIGNAIFTFHIWIIKGVFYVSQALSDMVAKHSFLGRIFSITMLVLRYCIKLGVVLFIHLSEIILALNSRSNEIEADTFAYKIGYGSELISGMYLLQKISMNSKMKFSQRMKASHPHIADRIAHLEKLENSDTEL